MQTSDPKTIEEQIVRYNELANSVNDSHLKDIFSNIIEERIEQLSYFEEKKQ